jgi:hypothetical protein
MSKTKLLFALILCAIPWSYFVVSKELILYRDSDATLSSPIQTAIPPPLQEFLATPLSFIGMGSQCLAFSTPTSPYVLKICKANRYQVPSICTWPIIKALCPSSMQIKEEKKAARKAKDFASYTLAFQELQKNTGVLFLHLKTHNSPSSCVTLIDPLGVSHKFPTNSLLFYIQYKATSLQTHIIDLLEDNKKEQLIAFLETLLQFLQDNEAGPLCVKDVNYAKNIGVFGNKPFWIDPGRIIAKKNGTPDRATTYNSLLCFLQSFAPKAAHTLQLECNLH